MPRSPRPDDDETVCFCIGVTKGQLRDAIADGARDLQSLVKATGAMGGCMSCRWDLEDLVQEDGPGEQRA